MLGQHVSDIPQLKQKTAHFPVTTASGIMASCIQILTVQHKPAYTMLENGLLYLSTFSLLVLISVSYRYQPEHAQQKQNGSLFSLSLICAGSAKTSQPLKTSSKSPFPCSNSPLLELCHNNSVLCTHCYTLFSLQCAASYSPPFLAAPNQLHHKLPPPWQKRLSLPATKSHKEVENQHGWGTMLSCRVSKLCRHCPAPVSMTRTVT